jgi:Tol biopolymer transport system component
MTDLTLATSLVVLTLVVACDEAPVAPSDEVAEQHTAVAESSAPLLVFEQGKGDARDLFVIPAAGGVQRRLTTDSATDGLPRWSADGRSILFTSNRLGEWQIWRVPAGGGEPARARANDHREWQADESPDGRRLAFLSNAGGAEWLWIQDLESGDAQPLVRHGQRTIMGNPDFSPDGRRVVFSSNWKRGHQIYVASVATGEAERISKVGGCEPRFSPNGRKVVYVGRRPRRDRSEILEHDLASGDEKILVAWPALNYDPVYSPDGEEIAFASTVTGGWEIYRQRLADGRAFRVTFAGEEARYPDYRPLPRAR